MKWEFSKKIKLIVCKFNENQAFSGMYRNLVSLNRITIRLNFAKRGLVCIKMWIFLL